MATKYSDLMDRIGYQPVQGSRHSVATDEEIERTEQHIGYTLPNDYRVFLAHYGLTRGKSILRYRSTVDDASDDSSIGVFYGIENDHTYDLASNWDVFQPDLPSQYLAIASSPGGQIVLSLAGEDVGSVYWWAQNRGSADYTDDLELIATGFDEFIRSVRSMPE